MDEHDLTDPHGEAEALRKENADLRRTIQNLRQIERNVQAERERQFRRAEAAEATLAASSAPDPVVNADSRQPGDLISRAAAIEGIARLADVCDALIRDGHPYAPSVAARRDGLLSAISVIHALPAAHVAEAQPVAWLIEGYGPTDHEAFAHQYGAKARKKVTPIYAHPPASQPTIGGAELDALVKRLLDGPSRVYRDIEADKRAADAITALRAHPDWKAMAERLGEAGGKLDKAAAEVIARGAQTGPQWSRLTVASLHFRAALSDLAKMKGE